MFKLEPPVWVDLWAVIGIGFEIWGFWWLLKYGRTPKNSELTSWLRKNGFEESWQAKYTNEITTMYLDNDAIQQKDVLSGVPTNFKKYWNDRKTYSIILVIIGLAGQLMQLLIIDAIKVIFPQ